MFEQAGDSVGSNWKFWLVLATIVVALLLILVWVLRMTLMPLKSYKGELAPLTVEETEISGHLSQHLKYLSETIGERNLSKVGTLEAAADYIRSSLQQEGYSVTEQTYSVGGQQVLNLEAKLVGSETGGETVVVGAHYDSVETSPGANDNASGVAAVLELARIFKGFRPRRTLRFVLFVNEEPPYFQTESMGSLVYARQLRRDHIPVSAMISLETIGCYSDAPGSQKYPVLLGLLYPNRGNFIGFVGNPSSRALLRQVVRKFRETTRFPSLLGLLYPNRGNFIGFVGNPSSRALLRQVVRKFRETTRFPSEGVAAPGEWPGVGWSDHWSFWQEQYPAIMVTDTALFRYPYYHTPFDTPNRVDFGKMTRVVSGVRRVVEALSSEE